MVNVRIKDHVEFAYTYEEGQKIYDLIAPSMIEGEIVTLSFDGLKAVPSSFLNAAVLQLAEKLSISDIKGQLRIQHSTNQINEMILRSFDTIAQRAT